jgi:hypothetical protein
MRSTRTRVEKIQVALLDLPRMLESIIFDLVAAQPDMEVVQPTSGWFDEVSAEPASVDVVLVGGGTPTEDVLRRLLAARARLRVLAVAADARSGVVHQLLPRELELGDISPTSLLGAIRQSEPSPPE